MLDYIVLEDFVPYENAFLFHIFKNNDRIELNQNHTTIFVWIHKIGDEYLNKGMHHRLRLEVQRDDLKIGDNFDVLKNILSQEIVGFSALDFMTQDIWYCV